MSTAGRPSGTAATATATANRRASSKRSMPSTPTPATVSTTASAAIHRAIRCPKCSRRRSSGVRSASTAPSIVAMRPIADSSPVRVTSIQARPRTASVPEKTSSPAARSTGTDSPVRIDSSICRACSLVRTPSAGIRSPASTRTRSPGTSRVASSSFEVVVAHHPHPRRGEFLQSVRGRPRPGTPATPPSRC